jgi:hypothetical protein
MTDASPPAPVGFTVRVPPSWIEFDLWRATHSGLIKRLLDERLAEAPELEPYRGALSKLVREMADEAIRQGAVFCATMLDRDGDAGVLAATLMVFHTEGAPDADDNTVEAIAGQVNAHAPSEASPTWRRVEIVDLPAGRAVQVHGIEVASSSGRPTLEGVVMQTLLPMPREAGVLNIVLSSPQTAIAEPMLDLFRAITDTFAWSSTNSTVVNGSAR